MSKLNNPPQKWMALKDVKCVMKNGRTYNVMVPSTSNYDYSQVNLRHLKLVAMRSFGSPSAEGEPATNRWYRIAGAVERGVQRLGKSILNTALNAEAVDEAGDEAGKGCGGLVEGSPESVKSDRDRVTNPVDSDVAMDDDSSLPEIGSVFSTLQSDDMKVDWGDLDATDQSNTILTTPEDLHPVVRVNPALAGPSYHYKNGRQKTIVFRDRFGLVVGFRNPDEFTDPPEPIDNKPKRVVNVQKIPIQINMPILPNIPVAEPTERLSPAIQQRWRRGRAKSRPVPKIYIPKPPKHEGNKLTSITMTEYISNKEPQSGSVIATPINRRDVGTSTNRHVDVLNNIVKRKKSDNNVESSKNPLPHRGPNVFDVFRPDTDESDVWSLLQNESVAIKPDPDPIPHNSGRDPDPILLRLKPDPDALPHNPGTYPDPIEHKPRLDRVAIVRIPRLVPLIQSHKNKTVRNSSPNSPGTVRNSSPNSPGTAPDHVLHSPGPAPDHVLRKRRALDNPLPTSAESLIPTRRSTRNSCPTYAKICSHADRIQDRNRKCTPAQPHDSTDPSLDPNRIGENNTRIDELKKDIVLQQAEIELLKKRRRTKNEVLDMLDA